MAVAMLSVSCDAAQIAGESFDYAPPASPLGAQGGGSGWLGPWFQDGESTVIGPVGLAFTDSVGNVLKVAGLSADTSGASTTRSLRELGSGLQNNVWISFLYQLPATNAKFEGVSFYRGTQQAFSVSNPTTTATAAIFLTNNLTGGATVNTGIGVFGRTHLIALKLTKGGGTGGVDRVDRVELFVDPVLTGTPTAPAATVNGANFDFDRVRMAGQDGSSLLVDELRVGHTFSDVTPYIPVAGVDSDGDGLTDAQETVLGLNPNVSDAALIAGIQTHSSWFDLYTVSGIQGLANGGVVLSRAADDPVNLIFEIQQSENLSQWGVLETFNRQVELPSGKNFLRVTLQDR